MSISLIGRAASSSAQALLSKCEPATHLSSGGRVASPAQALLLRYDALLHEYGLPVKMATSAIVNFSADTVFQCATRDSWDPRRSAAVGFFYGCCWYAPFMHTVTTTWGRVLPSTAPTSLAFKSAVDVSTSFVVNLCFVIGGQAYLRGDDPAETVRENLFDAWTFGCCFHPFSNMVVYSVPVIYRVLTLNGFSFIWNSFLIRRCQQRATAAAEAEAAAATEAAKPVR